MLEPRIDVPGGGNLVILSDYLFSSESDHVVQESEVSTTEVTPSPSPTISVESPVSDGTNSTFFQNLVDLLSFFKNGVRVFQHFLSRSNVSHLLKNGK